MGARPENRDRSGPQPALLLERKDTGGQHVGDGQASGDFGDGHQPSGAERKKMKKRAAFGFKSKIPEWSRANPPSGTTRIHALKPHLSGESRDDGTGRPNHPGRPGVVLEAAQALRPGGGALPRFRGKRLGRRPGRGIGHRVPPGGDRKAAKQNHHLRLRFQPGLRGGVRVSLLHAVGHGHVASRGRGTYDCKEVSPAANPERADAAV